MGWHTSTCDYLGALPKSKNAFLTVENASCLHKTQVIVTGLQVSLEKINEQKRRKENLRRLKGMYRNTFIVSKGNMPTCSTIPAQEPI